MKRTGNDDYRRLGLIDEVSSFRVMKNKFMTVCQTYPPILIAPLTMSDESMKSLSKLFKRDRIPAIVWKSKENVTLSRSEAFSVSEVLRNRRRVNEDPHDPVRDLETWLLAVAKLAPLKTGQAHSVLMGSDQVLFWHQKQIKSFI